MGCEESKEECVISTKIADNTLIEDFYEKKKCIDHTNNNHISELLNIILKSENLSNPCANKNIHDDILADALKIYNRVKIQKLKEIDSNIDSFLAHITHTLILDRRTTQHNGNIIAINKQEYCRNIYTPQITLNNYKYYANYLSLLLNEINSDLKETIFLTTEFTNDITKQDVYTLTVAYINCTNLEYISQYENDRHTLKKIIIELTKEYTTLNEKNIKLFIDNIKTLETIKNKLIFFNEYITLSFNKIPAIKSNFLNILYMKYLKNYFNIIIIDIDYKYEVCIEYIE